MIRLPLITHVRVADYGLFPGKSEGSGIDWPLPSGLTLVAGINGLGKTTLLTMILRAMTGPYDLSREPTANSLDVVVAERPVELGADAIKYFARRVADGAKNARVVLSLQFGERAIEIERSLANLDLLSLTVDGDARALESRRRTREATYQALLCDLFALPSFVDILLVLHYVTFFLEDRPGALWDENAQRQVLRALFVPGAQALKVAQLEREVNSRDSEARNLQAQVFGLNKQLTDAQAREAQSPEIKAEFDLLQSVVSADLVRKSELERRISDLDRERTSLRLERERAKLTNDEAERVVERLKYTAIGRLFPSMPDAARLLFAKLLESGECLLCGAQAKRASADFEQMLSKGQCPVCKSVPRSIREVVPASTVERKRISSARQQATLSRTQIANLSNELAQLSEGYAHAVTDLDTLQQSISDRQGRLLQLGAQLPDPSLNVSELESALKVQRRRQEEALAQREVAIKKLRRVQTATSEQISEQSERLSRAFGRYVKQILTERARLAPIEGKARLTQAGEPFTIPAFAPEMAAANKAGLVRRQSSSDVSESQRELIELAFRLALMDVAAPGESSSFVMETPEASLDLFAMQRLGDCLLSYAEKNDNRLVVTTNLTNAGIISSLFGGRTKSQVVIADRTRHVLNLLEIAAPNAALTRDVRRYKRLLTRAISGA